MMALLPTTTGDIVYCLRQRICVTVSLKVAHHDADESGLGSADTKVRRPTLTGWLADGSLPRGIERLIGGAYGGAVCTK